MDVFLNCRRSFCFFLGGRLRAGVGYEKIILFEMTFVCLHGFTFFLLVINGEGIKLTVVQDTELQSYNLQIAMAAFFSAGRRSLISCFSID